LSRFLVRIATGWTRRRATNVGTLILGLANGIISYDALSGAAHDAGLQAPFSLLFPLATDGIIGVATPAQLLLRDRNAPWWARAQIGIMLWAAIVFSVVGNASRAAQVWSGITVYGVPVPTWHAVWLALPPLAYAGALHVLGLVHRYPVPGDLVADADATRLLAESERALTEARAEVSSLVRSLTEARSEPPAEERARPEPSARAPKAESAPPSRARAGRAKSAPSPDGAPKRLPAGARHEQVRALLAEPGGRDLTGDEIAARLGIDDGYARRLRAEVLEAESAPALALVGTERVDADEEGAHRPRRETTHNAAGPMPAVQQEA
jgi:hypothetical protein